MALTYAQLVDLVRTWSNKDEEVVSDDIIKDALKYAADKAYRILRAPPLENVAIYEKSLLLAATTAATNVQSSTTEIQLPYDLVEFIQIRINGKQHEPIPQLNPKNQFFITPKSNANDFLTSKMPRAIILNKKGIITNGFASISSKKTHKDLKKLK